MPSDELKKLSINAAQGRLPGQSAPNGPLDTEVTGQDLVNPPRPIPLAASEPLETPQQVVQRVAAPTLQTAVRDADRARQEQEAQFQARQNDVNALLGQEVPDQQQLIASTLDRFGTPDAFRDFENTVDQLNALNTQFDLGNVALQGAAGQETGTLAREITQNERARAVRTQGLAAKAELLRGNIDLARSIARDTANFAFQERSQNLSALQNQLELAYDQLSTAEKRQADLTFQQIAQEREQLNALRDNVAAAYATGVATPEEMEQLGDPSIPDDQKQALAQSIQARAATQDRSLAVRQSEADIQARLASAAASWASAEASNALAAQRVAETGAMLTDSNGEIVEVPSFDEWATANGGKAYATGELDNQQLAQLRQEYDAEMEVVRRANALQTVSPLAREVMKNPKGYFDLTPTKRGEILEELANAGIDTAQLQNGNRIKLSDTQVNELAQAQLARRNVEKLYNMLQELPGTGPISGRLQSLNPYDPIVKAINAQINRTLPGLARGIFKEVGVLTDQDIERYRQTLANQNYTDEQLERLHQDTLSVIDDSITISTGLYEDLGYDLGEFDVEEAIGGEPDDGLTDDEAWEEYQKMINSSE